MPQISVIMPTYNRGWIIERALSSVFNQTYTDFELIVIDDGSDDTTSAILERVADNRLIRASSQRIGSAGARNVGLQLAAGKFITYLDSDNTWSPDFLAVMHQEIEDNVLAYSGQNLLLVERTDDGEQVLGRATRTHPYTPTELLKGNYIDINAVMHTAAVLDEVGVFDKDLPKLVDWDLFVRIVIKHPLRIKYIDQVLGNYYYYTAASAETITNKSNEADIFKSFGLGEQEEASKIVLSRIERLRRQSS